MKLVAVTCLDRTDQPRQYTASLGDGAAGHELLCACCGESVPVPAGNELHRLEPRRSA